MGSVMYKLADMGRAAPLEDMDPVEGDSRYMALELLAEADAFRSLGFPRREALWAVKGLSGEWGAERDAAFFALNGQLLRNPALVNLLDGCALSLPCHEAGELPVGLMLWHGACRDDGVLHVAQLAEAALSRTS